MKKNLFVVLLFWISLNGNAQRHELGAFFGGSYYIGDLNPSGHFAQANPSVGILYRYNFNPRWALRINALFGTVEASDAVNNNNDPRNLSFKSPITEFSGQFELNFLQFYTKSEKYRFSPYIFAGLGLFNFNPQAQYDGKWYELQPLSTEGEGLAPGKSTYSLTSLCIPFGLGIKIGLFKTFCLGLEWGMRKTFTDYIDDVSTTYVNPNVFSLVQDNYSGISAILADRSAVKHPDGAQRGNSANNDWYNFFGVTLSFHLGNKETTCASFNK